MRSIDEFFSMGGHGAFIWPSFAVAAVVMAVLLVASLRSLRVRQSDLKALQEAQHDGVTGEARDEA